MDFQLPGFGIGEVACWGSGSDAGVGGPAGILLRLFQLSCFTFDISCHSGGLLGFDIMTGPGPFGKIENRGTKSWKIEDCHRAMAAIGSSLSYVSYVKR